MDVKWRASSRLNEENLLRRCDRRLILGHVDRFPFAFFDSVANLGGSLALLGLLVRIQPFAQADAAIRRMLSGVAVEQTAVTGVTVAVAVARLLVQNFFDL